MAEYDEVNRTFEENMAKLRVNINELAEDIIRVKDMAKVEERLNDLQKNDQLINTEYMLLLKSCYEQLRQYNDPNYIM